MEGEFAFLWRALQMPAYRCTRCRRHFFSMLKRKQEVVSENKEPSAA
jgi:hypothetical protein